MDTTNLQTVQFKRGDTFKARCTTDVPLTGYSIASQIRNNLGVLVDTFTVVITQEMPTGTYTLEAPNGTNAWPLGENYCDIQYTTALGEIISTETFIINVLRDETRI